MNEVQLLIKQVTVRFESTDLMVSDSKIQHLTIDLREHNFDNVESVKFLGIHVDPSLKWNVISRMQKIMS